MQQACQGGGTSANAASSNWRSCSANLSRSMRIASTFSLATWRQALAKQHFGTYNAALELMLHPVVSRFTYKHDRA